MAPKKQQQPTRVALTRKVTRLENLVQKYKNERDLEKKKLKELNREKKLLETAIGSLLRPGFHLLKSGWTPTVVRSVVRKVFDGTGPIPKVTQTSGTD